jgi:hypothetical protein
VSSIAAADPSRTVLSMTPNFWRVGLATTRTLQYSTISE